MAKKNGVKTSAWQTLGYFWAEQKKNLQFVLPLWVCVILGALAQNYASTYVISLIFDGLGGVGDFSLGQLWEKFGLLVLIYFLFQLFGNIFWRLIIYLDWKLSSRVTFGLGRTAFSALSTQSMSFHHDRFGGSLVSAVNQFTNAYDNLFDMVVFRLSNLILATIVVFSVTLARVPWYALVLALLAFVFMAVVITSYKFVMPLQEKEAKLSNKLSGVLADSISNILTVKSYGQEKSEQARFAKVNLAKQKATFSLIRAVTLRDSGFSAVSLILNTVIILVLVFGHALWGISLGTLYLVSVYSWDLFSALWDAPYIMRSLNQQLANAKEMTEILNTQATVFDRPGAPALKVKRGHINFSKISFAHPENPDAVFQNFSLTIAPGQRVGLVGRSGSGKTTLTKLLLRFADLQAGEISIDGQNIAAVTQESLRHQIAYVPQESTLFHRTLRENIAYGRPDASEAAVIRAAKQANAWEFISKLPKGLDTLTGERGVKLSGGQRQRIVIARAIVKNAPILVLDEATSALDSESEKLIQEALQTLMAGRTCIVIAHRLSTVSQLDRIVVLKDGQIVEDGSHQTLIAQSGEYAHLWQRQSGAFLEGEGSAPSA